MTAIWSNDGAGWRLLAPSGFVDERSLHTLVEQAPQLLPLAGSPKLVVLGREVQIGNGFADLIAIEPSGRVAVIEVKLARNAEVRRAIIAQVLTYAAYLRGADIRYFEESVLGGHLARRGYSSVADAVAQQDQEGSYEKERFESALGESLATGRFRLVLVLDEAPEELIRLVGYLESAAHVLIDLVTVSSYRLAGSEFIVPQRIDPARQEPSVTLPAIEPAEGRGTEGSEQFRAFIDNVAGEYKPELERLFQWALQLETDRLARLFTYRGRSTTNLLPCLTTEYAGLVTIWGYANGRSAMTVWRSVLERRAPQTLAQIEAIVAPQAFRHQAYLRDVSEKLMQAITAAYKEAARGPDNRMLVAN